MLMALAVNQCISSLFVHQDFRWLAFRIQEINVSPVYLGTVYPGEMDEVLVLFRVQRKKKEWVRQWYGSSLCISAWRTLRHTLRSLITSGLEDRERGVFVHLFIWVLFSDQFGGCLGMGFLYDIGCDLPLRPPLQGLGHWWTFGLCCSTVAHKHRFS